MLQDTLIDLAEAGDAKGAAVLMRAHILDWTPILTEARQHKAGRGPL